MISKPPKLRAASDELAWPPSPQVAEALANMPFEAVGQVIKSNPLEARLAEMHGVREEQVFLEAGALGVMHRILDAVLAPSSTMLFPMGGYPEYLRIAEDQGAYVEYYEAEEYIGDRHYVRRSMHADGSMDESRTEYKEPTGSHYYNPHRLEDMLANLKPEVLVLIDPDTPGFAAPYTTDVGPLRIPPDTLRVVDQTHVGFTQFPRPEVAELLDEHPNTVVIRSFSKFYGLPNARIGYGILGEQALKTVPFRHRYLGFNGMSQVLANAALDSHNYYENVAAEMRAQRTRFGRAVSQLDGYFPLAPCEKMSVATVIPPEQYETFKLSAEHAQIELRDLSFYDPRIQHTMKATIGPKPHTDRLIDLFESVSWVYTPPKPREATRGRRWDRHSIETRPDGYTVGLYEWDQDDGSVFAINRVIVPPGCEIYEHRHQFADEKYIMCTPTHLKLDGQWSRFDAGSEVPIPPGLLHGVGAIDTFARFEVEVKNYQRDDKFDVDGDQMVRQSIT